MPRPRDLPPASSYKHGTRTRYVTGCRCRPCTHANALAYHELERKAKAAALELPVWEGEPEPSLQLWTAPDGTKKIRIYKRACAGINGKKCPHGSHLRKDSTGDICMRCRKKLVWNGLVSAKAARHHLLILSNAGVGYKSAAAAASVTCNVVAKIVNGKRTQIRANTERAILEVDENVIADHALVDAGPVWDMVQRLRRHGYTKVAIARRIGQNGPGLQLGKKRVLAKTALKITKMLRDADGDFLRR